jgi:hypothetical protein
MVRVRCGDREVVLGSGKLLRPGQVAVLDGKAAVRLVSLGLATFASKPLVEHAVTPPLERRVFCWPGA